MFCTLQLGGWGREFLELCGIPIDLEFFDHIFHGSSSHTNTGIVFSSYKIRSTCIFWHRMAWLLASTVFRAYKKNHRHFIVVHSYPNVSYMIFSSLSLSFLSLVDFSSQFIFCFLLMLCEQYFLNVVWFSYYLGGFKALQICVAPVNPVATKTASKNVQSNKIKVICQRSRVIQHFQKLVP